MVESFNSDQPLGYGDFGPIAVLSNVQRQCLCAHVSLPRWFFPRRFGLAVELLHRRSRVICEYHHAAAKAKNKPLLVQLIERLRTNKGLILDGLALVPLVVVFTFNPTLTWLRMLHFHRFFHVLDQSTYRLNSWTQRMVLLVVSVVLILHWTGTVSGLSSVNFPYNAT